MKKCINSWARVLGFVIVLIYGAGCPHREIGETSALSNPPFFKDVIPDQGPWLVKAGFDKNIYHKLYALRSGGAYIWATFVRIDEPLNIDITNPANQKVLAEIALQAFCKAQEEKCLAISSDVAWIVGVPLKYIYVRFNAEREGFPPMRGLVYYRFDQPYQTMFILLADDRIYDSYETVFFNYLSEVSFNPERF